MTRRQTNKYRICRQLGENLWGSHSTYKHTRSPGEHGSEDKQKTVSKFLVKYEPKYKTQLREKQKVKKYYGEGTETQLVSLYAKAVKCKGATTTNLAVLLERQLISVVYRTGIAPTIHASRQLINHGHICVNGQRVQFPTYCVQNNDLIHMHPNSVYNSKIQDKCNTIQTPSYIKQVVSPIFGFLFLKSPNYNEIPYNTTMDYNAVIAYYSRA